MAGFGHMKTSCKLDVDRHIPCIIVPKNQPSMAGDNTWGITMKKYGILILIFLSTIFTANCAVKAAAKDTAAGTTAAGKTPLNITGIVTTFAGTANTTGSTNGTGVAALFNWPAGITSDGTNLYVAERVNHTIRKIVIASGVVTTLAGTAGVTGNTDGTGAAASFVEPQDITSDGTNLYITDNGGNTIRQIVISTGVVTTLAGTGGTFGSTDATGTAARFSGPAGITLEGTTLYVVDRANSTIRKIDISTGAVTTLAGLAGNVGSTDGTGVAARFKVPSGITSDGANLYVTDTQNNTIRKLLLLQV
jgi:hypothetical protein